MNRLTLAVIVGVMILLIVAHCGKQHVMEEANAHFIKTDATLTAEQVVGDLREPVSLVFLSPRVMLVAERAGRVRWVEDGIPRATPFAVLPVANVPDGGLLSLAVDPKYPDRPYVYALYTVPDFNGRPTGERVSRLTVKDGLGVEPTAIMDGLPAAGRIAFGHDGMLYLTIGDAGHPEQAQDYTALAGKVLRITPGGGAVADNPIITQTYASAVTAADAEKPIVATRTPIYAVGLRNPRGIAVSSAGDIYLTDTGPNHDDEIDRLVAGDNYGWPNTRGNAGDPHFRSPLWSSGKSAVAPTGAAFYTGVALPEFAGNLFFAAADGKLRRAVFANRDRISRVIVVPEAGANARLDVAMGPDGNLYFSSMTAVYRLTMQ